MHLSRINGTPHQLKPLYLQPSKSSFCIFSLAFSNCGDQIIGGGSDGCLYIYDLVLAKRTFRCPVSHSSLKVIMICFQHILVVELSRFLILQFELDALDVNAVGFIDETSNIIYSGSDNGIIKVRKKIILCMIYTQQRLVKHGTELTIRPQNGSEYPEHIHFFWKNSFEKS